MKCSFRLAGLLVVAGLVLSACDLGGSPPTSPGAVTTPPNATNLSATPQPNRSAPTSAPSPTVQSSAVPTSVPPTSTPTSSPTAAPSSTSAGGVLSGEPRVILRNVYARLASAGPYRIIETNTYTIGGQTQAQSWTREFVPPGRVRIVGKPEMIQIDRVWYMQDGSGKWSKSDVPPAQNGQRANVADFLAQAISDVQVAGTEILNATPTVVFTMNVNLPQMNLTGPFKLWVGAADGLPRQSDLDGTLNVSGKSAKLLTHTVYEYDPNIKIEPPIP